MCLSAAAADTSPSGVRASLFSDTISWLSLPWSRMAPLLAFRKDSFHALVRLSARFLALLVSLLQPACTLMAPFMDSVQGLCSFDLHGLLGLAPLLLRSGQGGMQALPSRIL